MLDPIRVLTVDDMERIHQAALTILADVGMRIDHERARERLRDAGCKVDGEVVTFPRAVVQPAVDKMKRDYADGEGRPARMAARYSHVRFRAEPHRIHRDFTVNAGGFCCFIEDLGGTRRPATMDDVLRSIHMVNALDDVTHTGLPVADQETPVGIRPVAMAAALAKHTAKLGGVETFKVEDIPYLIEIGTIVKGSLKALQAEPVLIGYAEARSPLCFDRNMVEIFMDYIERGFPQTLDTMPNGGATGPVTPAGLIALGCAETLAAVVLAYAIRDDAVVGVDIIPSFCDMQTGVFMYGGTCRMPLLAARVQMISEYYGCPSGVHGGKTDSCLSDVQCGVEKALSTAWPVLAGAVGIGTVGALENAVTFSPRQLVIDNEIVRAVRGILRPIEVNDETLALDVVGQVGIGGNYLAEMHTAEHFREELLLSDLFTTETWESAHAGPGPMEAKAEEAARRLWSELPEPVLDHDQLRAVDAVVASAEKHLSA